MATDHDVGELLGGLPMFASVPAADLATATASARVRRYPRGQVIFSTGDPGDTLLVVVSGRLKVLVRSADGGELTLAIVGAGGVVGDLGVIDGGVRSADAETLEETELLLLPSQVILDLRQRFPAVNQSLLVTVAAGFRRLTEDVADLVFLDLPRRVGKALLHYPRDSAGVVDLGLNQEQLAHRVAGTRQSVNQALRGFERRGWIVMDGRQIVLRDPAELARFSGDQMSAG